MLNVQEIQVSASTLCQFRSKTSWCVICPSNNLYLKQTSSIQNTAHLALACSFWHHTSLSYPNWDFLNDSDFKAWVKYLGMPCSAPDTFTSSCTKPWPLVISLIDGYLKMSHAKSTWQDKTESILLQLQRLKENLHEIVPGTYHRQYKNLNSIYFWEHLWLSSPQAYRK